MLLVFSVLSVIVKIFIFSPEKELAIYPHDYSLPCEWERGDPVMYLFDTKLHVPLKASHWFHMAEKYLSHFSLFRERNLLVPPLTKQVFYHFAKCKCD